MWRFLRVPIGGALLGLLLHPTLLQAEPRPFVVPTLRPNAGLFALLNDDKERGVAFHLPVGIAIGWTSSGIGRLIERTPWLLPELSYELRTSGHHSSHAISLGCGFGYGVLPPIIGTYTPRIVVGSADGQAAFGFRHGFGVHILMSALSFELSHQVLRTSALTTHEIQFTAGLNLGLLILPALWD